jgi:hypothetical protein
MSRKRKPVLTDPQELFCPPIARAGEASHVARVLVNELRKKLADAEAKLADCVQEERRAVATAYENRRNLSGDTLRQVLRLEAYHRSCTDGLCHNEGVSAVLEELDSLIAAKG